MARRAQPTFVCLCVVAAACSVPPPMPDPEPPHPASPATAEAPRAPQSDTLSMPERRATPSTGARGH